MAAQGRISIYEISDGEIKINIEIRRSGRRTLGLEVKPDGSVLARMPVRLTDREVTEFLEKHRDWMIQKVCQMKEKTEKGETTHAVPVRSLTPQEIDRIKDKIYRRVLYYSRKMGVTFGRITVRNQKTRWGSCSSKGNLNFNYQLCYLPEELLDYVVVHELAHRRYMNHSPEFWQEVKKYFPDYLECRKRLKQIRLVEE